MICNHTLTVYYCSMKYIVVATSLLILLSSCGKVYNSSMPIPLIYQDKNNYIDTLKVGILKSVDSTFFYVVTKEYKLADTILLAIERTKIRLVATSEKFNGNKDKYILYNLKDFETVLLKMNRIDLLVFTTIDSDNTTEVVAAENYIKKADGFRMTRPTEVVFKEFYNGTQFPVRLED